MNDASSQLAGAQPRSRTAVRNGPHALCSVLALAMLMTLAGCFSSTRGVECDVRPEFLTHDRVALWSSLPRETEDFFIPLYMQAFPTQILVERRDVNAIVGEQDILPDRLDEATRAKLRKILGVKAILYPSITKDGFAMKVIETETGAITASVFVYGTDKTIGRIPMQDLVRKAISALRSRANHQPAESAPDVPAVITPIKPPPHD